MQRIVFSLSFVFLLLGSSGCKSAYYSGMGKLGFEKRDILVDRVEGGRNAREDAKEQMVSVTQTQPK